MKGARKLLLWLLLIAVLGAGAYLKQVAPARETAEVSAKPAAASVPASEKAPETPAPSVIRGHVYDDKDSVAEYIHLYGELPPNYITKSEAKKLGWPGGDLRPYAPDKCIGGDRFGNFEGKLPKEKGRVYRECDVGTLGKSSRGPKRLVYADDGWIYYTADHYETFETLYKGK